MPKDKSKKPHAKSADFSKQKHKVGHKLVPQSTTNTAIAAKTINLPNQSLTVDKSGQPTTSRNLTLDDLLVRIGHSSVTQKKDGLVGLTELLVSHPTLVASTSAKIIPACSALPTVPDSSVRKAYIKFFEWYTSVLPMSLLKPFLRMIVLQTKLALSDIRSDVRFDALKIINILIAVLPAETTKGWDTWNDTEVSHTHSQNGRLLYDSFATLLNVPLNNTGKATVVPTTLSAASRANLLESFRGFLEAAQPKDNLGDDLPLFLAPAFASQGAYHAYLDEVRPKRTRRSLDADIDAWVIGRPHRSSDGPSFYQAVNTWKNVCANMASPLEYNATAGRFETARVKIANLTQGPINTFFSEAINAALVDAKLGAQSECLRIVQACLSISNLLWEDIDSKTPPKALGNLAKLMTAANTYLPTMNSSDRVYETIDIAYCKLVSLWQTSRQNQAGRSDKLKDKVVDPASMHKYVVHFLEESSAKRGDDGLSAFHALKPLIWTLLNDTKSTRDMIGALLHAQSRHQATHRLSTAINRFFIDVSVAQAQRTYTGNFRWSDHGDLYREWIRKLPQSLYMLADRIPEDSLAILRFLHNISRHPSSQFVASVYKDPDFLQGLAAFFWKSNPKTGADAFGPYCHLADEAKQVANSLVVYVNLRTEAPPGEVQSLRKACEKAQSRVGSLC